MKKLFYVFLLVSFFVIFISNFVFADPLNLWSDSGSNIYYNSGNVGIGTTNPEQKLDVSGGTARFQPAATTGQLNIELMGEASFPGYSNIATNAYFGTSNWRYRQTGGYGTLLDVVNGAYHFLNTATAGTADGIVTWVEPLTILNSGNVGIGTVSPSQKLEVNGNLKVNGVIYTDGVVSTSTTFICNSSPESVATSNASTYLLGFQIFISTLTFFVVLSFKV